MATLTLLTLAAFGLSYVILDSELLKKPREYWWPEFSCYFCVGFWCGVVLRGLYLAVYPPEHVDHGHLACIIVLEMMLYGLASCAVSGLLSLVLDVFREEE